MSHRAGSIAVVVALGLAGCGGGDDPAPETTSASTTTCPNGEDRRGVIYDLGENPDVEPTTDAAVEVFLRREGGDASLEDFELVKEGEREATYSFSDGEFELARIYVERFGRGWLVISYEYCKGAI